MSDRFITPLGAVGIAITLLVVLLASFFIARTPGAQLGDDIVPGREVASDRAQVEYTLPEGRSAGDIGKDLKSLGVLKSGQQFEFLVSLMGLESNLSAGDYVLKKNSSALTIVSELTVQESAQVLRVTFPEGLRFEEMAVIAERAGFGTEQDFLDAVAVALPPPVFLESFPQGATLQGYLFPDTYFMPVGSTAAELVAYMLRTLEERFSADLRAAAAAHGLNTHQALTLASIVEREAVLESERPRIAGVFYNRIEAGDTLGADPTVQFAVSFVPGSIEEFGYWKKEITLDDLKIQSPYNTREVPGIPPGPIASPGLSSIEAVAHPEDTQFYYFVADAVAGDGSHRFAVTFEEHQANDAQYGAP